MHRKKEKLVLAAAFMGAVILLTGCGSSAAGAQSKMATSPYAASYEADAQGDADWNAGASGQQGTMGRSAGAIQLNAAALSADGTSADASFHTDGISADASAGTDGDLSGSSSGADGDLGSSDASSGIAENSASDDSGSSSASSDAEENADYDQKLIKTVQLSVETRNLDDFENKLTAQAKASGGYIESMNRDGGSSIVTDYNEDPSVSTDSGNGDDAALTDNASDYAQTYSTVQSGDFDAAAQSDGYSYSPTGSQSSRSGYYTVRIPAKKLDTFLGTVEKETNVLNQSISTEDVTLNYIDVDSQRKALEEEQKNLLKMMDKAKKVEDMIQIESQLADVRSQLQNIVSQLRYMDNQVNYSTVNISVTEVRAYTPPQQLSAADRMKQGFRKSVEGLTSGLQESGIWFVIHLPYIIFWIIVLIAAGLLVRFIVQRYRMRKVRKETKATGKTSAKMNQSSQDKKEPSQK